MKYLYKPYGFLFTITLPQMIIVGLFSKMFYIIQSQLSKEGVATWGILGAYFMLAYILFTGYSIKSGRRKKEIHPYWAIGIFITYVLFILVYFFQHDSIIPSNIPNWMLLDMRPGIYMLTAIMPVFVHTLVILVHWTMEKYKINHVSRDVYFLLGIPAIWYLAGRFIGLGRLHKLEALMPILFVVSLVSFVFFLVRIICVILKQKSVMVQNHLAPIVLFCSLLGLSLNQSLGNILGDFSHYGFYLLAVFTGLLMMMPSIEHPKKRLVLFMGKSVTYVFTLYFFMVFLPYVPLAFIGIIFIGLGILMFTPLVLMFLHTRSLWWDFKFLNLHYSKSYLVIIFIIGVSILPASFMLMIAGDKECLDNALEYVYQRSYEDEKVPQINTSSIKRTLKNIKYMKGMSRDDFGIFTTKTPYLTSFYDDYVLDHLSLSTRKIHQLEQVFLGESTVYVNDEDELDTTNEDVIIKKITTDTLFDKKEGIYKSWVHFEMENTTDFQTEYSTVFTLPEGSYISDYYLYVGKNKKHGMIADKRAANWVYQQIKRVRRDPGILTYIGDDQVDFKVFPFNEHEVRKTGIEIIHRKPISLNIDERVIDLKDEEGNVSIQKKDTYIHQGIAYITKEMKASLPIVTRTPKYYFILDYSKGNEKEIYNYLRRTKDYIQENHLQEAVGEIIALNYEEKIAIPKGNWEENLKSVPTKGGFYVDYTLKRILYNHYLYYSKEYPVIVIVTDDMNEAILSKDLDNVAFVAPEGLHYYHLDDRGRLRKYDGSLDESKDIDEVGKTPVLTWKSQEDKILYLPDNGEDSIVLTTDILAIKEQDLKGSKWENAVILKAMYMHQQLHPEKAWEQSLEIVKGSISKHVMSPLTSYIVLENQAQERAMLEKQKQILATTKPVEVGDLTEMNEPPIAIMLLLGIGLLIIIRIYKKKQRCHSVLE
ncbi:MSEP-CTERM sorting domain-containing protein [Clostridiaceae bacterium 35-E11]